jgi:hypothetical protein
LNDLERYVYDECDGLCESPHDDPPRWCAMIYGYFDETEEAGYSVVAGFVGRKNAWKSLVKEWIKVSDGKPIHLKAMRLGHNKAPSRHGELLRKLGLLPAQCKVRPFVGYVKTSDYFPGIKGTTAELVLKGYMASLLAMVDCMMESDLRKTDRIEFLFEEKFEFATARAQLFEDLYRMPEYKIGDSGRSRIAKFSTLPKSTILEPSDYLSHAVWQSLVDPESQQARLTAPILESFDHIDSKTIAKEQIEGLMGVSLLSQGRTSFPAMDRYRKAFIKVKLKERLEEMRNERKR